MSWQPIETAPRGANGISFMLLAWGVQGDQCTGQGMRIDDDFYTAAVFYCLGKTKKPFELRETKITPTHWQPSPKPPEV